MLRINALIRNGFLKNEFAGHVLMIIMMLIRRYQLVQRRARTNRDRNYDKHGQWEPQGGIWIHVGTEAANGYESLVKEHRLLGFVLPQGS